MEKVELIQVYIDYRNGKTACICKQEKKGCSKDCKKDTVERDKFRDWKSTINNRYGL